MQKQILIVEDNELNRAMLCEILAENYRVLEAENGQNALDILQQYKDSIALILLDVMMPVMDGFAFLERVRKDESLSLIPVIVMTQNDSEEDELAALAHGATDFVPKPYRPQVLLHRVASLINLRETAAMVNQFRYDRLTGLYSKEFFCQQVQKTLEENPEEEYTIVCSNIENFKLFNDIFGTREGDLLLQEIAGITQDMAGETGFCGRFSADRFLCFQKRGREQQDRANFGKATGLHVSAHLSRTVMRWGIYEITDRSVPVEQMCDRAMLAADSIKGQYDRYFALYDDSLRTRLLREQAITEAMGTALDQKQFVVYYQPKYSLNDDCIASAEALVRWAHPQWGFMSPGEFIPLFEKNGFIPRLDRYVWEQVCAQLREWHDKGLPSMPVSVNVSRADVYQDDLADTLLALTEQYDIDPALLHLEITESAYTENPGQIIQTAQALRRYGFVVEMDDFGSGYSSLNLLSQMDLDILKLDMKFIQNEIAKPAERSILNDVITMAHRMHLGVVAEGVETREQMKRLQAVGCDYVQGYFFARPMPAAEFEELLKTCRPLGNDPVWVARQKKAELHRILVVDEDEQYRRKVCQTFEGQFHILQAADSASALDCIRSCREESVSAVILSMTLPESGAALVMSTLRQEPSFWTVPVLATIPNNETLEALPLALETDDFLCKHHPMFDLSKRVQHLMEIASLRHRESVLQDEANRDHLTGLLNRRGLQAAEAALRKEEQPLAVLLFDLDDLKKVNDTRGHDMGDRMIQAFSDLLRHKTRAEDILCRYGGDEFVVILKHLGDAQVAVRKGSDICRSFQASLEEEGIPAACSVGIAMCGADEKLSAELIERADQALYRAKRENKGNCCLWSEQL